MLPTMTARPDPWDRVAYGGVFLRVAQAFPHLVCGEIHGPVTAAMLCRVAQDWHERTLRAHGAVLDLQRCLVLFSLRQLLEATAGCAAACPCALVVRESELAMFHEYAWRVAHRGVMRDAFSDHPQALAWAQRHSLRWAQEASGRERTSDR